MAWTLCGKARSRIMMRRDKAALALWIFLLPFQWFVIANELLHCNLHTQRLPITAFKPSVCYWHH